MQQDNLLITSYRKTPNEKRDFAKPMIEIARRKFLMQSMMLDIFRLNTEQSQQDCFSVLLVSSFEAGDDLLSLVASFSRESGCASISISLMESVDFLVRQHNIFRHLLEPALKYYMQNEISIWCFSSPALCKGLENAITFRKRSYDF